MAAAFGPFVLLFGQDGVDQAADRGSVEEDPDDVGAAAELEVRLTSVQGAVDATVRSRSVNARRNAAGDG